jgi:DNA-binding response OmpR family regulator
MEYQTHKPTILVVDDSERVAQSLAMVLEHSGYTVVTAHTAEQALELASGVAIDLAAIDVQLPGVDGVRVAVELCKQLPNCKILLISGNAGTSELLEQARKEGIDFPILPKPIPPEQLLSTIRSLLGHG